MKAQILVISSYYNEENIKDGMIQRVKSVDDNLSNFDRIYLNIKIHKFFKKKVTHQRDNVKSYDINVIFHFFFILKCISKADVIYFHSIYNVIRIFPWFLLFRKKTILDVHGVVPEELVSVGRNFRAGLYSLVEKVAFRKMSLMIFVTESMADYYKKKYPGWHGAYKIFYIVPANLVVDNNTAIENNGKINVIYSGNTQKWQNIELMLNVIKNNLSENINYLILTGEPEVFNEQIKNLNINADKISVKSVHPNELAQYYNKAHYGFILRDDVVVNRVANPTKLIEYLCYGVTPIVKSAEIGDFMKLKYEYLNYEDFSDKLLPVKSEINLNIAKFIIENYDPQKIFDEIFEMLL
ncbi:glycosyltransferase family 4 protein [Mucilaginibacter sp. HC2]|uniref:glycosyltransferase family 4 protein n=1 Tax=Mucilaginibacter inviolabilis TaxID=2714892 RepID=UPI00140AE26A|nr:glycosyltransferase family 4 protein [Mucilaginibacter inviolabilis]NHA04455.1 glycosyltransferase family 4 protein [Mucilaginibacter inviolabilis]